jgi:tetratricopeptide (TPR) repeat protein
MISVNIRRALGACLVVSSLNAASSSSARAETLTPAPPAARPAAPDAEEALQRYQEGIAARQLGDWEKARALLLKSWELQRHFQTAANLGEMELKLGHRREAAEHLAYFLKEAPASIPDADRACGQTMLDQARASFGTLRVVAIPRDAALYVDGQKVGYLPRTIILVEPGRRRGGGEAGGCLSIAGSATSRRLRRRGGLECADHEIDGESPGRQDAGPRRDHRRRVAATAVGLAMGTGLDRVEVKRQSEMSSASPEGCRRPVRTLQRTERRGEF